MAREPDPRVIRTLLWLPVPFLLFVSAGLMANLAREALDPITVPRLIGGCFIAAIAFIATAVGYKRKAAWARWAAVLEFFGVAALQTNGTVSNLRDGGLSVLPCLQAAMAALYAWFAVALIRKS